MNTIRYQRCYNHHQREAVVRCPGCGNFYCRECIAEHDDRMLCSNCLRSLADSPDTRTRQWFRFLSIVAQAGIGWMMLCYAFYLLGKLLLAIPHDFHEGTLWQSSWWESL